MIRNNPHRNTAIFYTCGTCNLKCRYCGIDKNPALLEIDKMLAESFNGDYYFNRVKEYFPQADMLHEVQTWGGEPFLHMERFYPLLHQLIKEYPYLNSMYSSTNFSYPSWTDKLFGLMDVFGAYPYRKFKFLLQLSVDGPQYINDAGRGEGTTEKCVKNFDKLVQLLSENRLPENVDLTITLKGTLDDGSIKLLCSKEKIIEYYKFYEETFIDKIHKLNSNHIRIICTIPNTAVPSPVTVEDGKIFAELVRYCREIEEENKKSPIFQYYQVITPYVGNGCGTCLTYQRGYHTCGSGTTSVSFLPDNMMSTCHEGFTEFANEYKEFAAVSKRVDSGTITFDKYLKEQKVSMCTNDEGYANHEYKMNTYEHPDGTAMLSTSVSLIMALAMAGQIEERYINEMEALKAATFIQSHCCFCLKDNYNVTGSYSTAPVGIYKLLLNGAMQYIQSEEERRIC